MEETPVEEKVRRAVDDLASVERIMQEARALHDAARIRAEDALAEYGAALIADEGAHVDMSLMRELYWEHPAVPVKALAPLVGCGTNEVHAIVGPRGRGHGCEDCGAPLSRTSRTGTAVYWGASKWCEPCAGVRQAQRDTERRNDSAEWHALQKREENAARALFRAGITPDEITIRYSGADGRPVFLSAQDFADLSTL